MRSKQPLLFIAVGTICAGVAAFAMHKHMAAAEKSSAGQETMSILVAVRDIDFADPIVLQGYGENPNVGFATAWPRTLALEGAITAEGRIAERAVRATAHLVKHQPVLESQIIPEEQIVPEDMVIESVAVDLGHIRTGRLRAGMQVDVLQIGHSGPAPFMRNVRLYAIGNLDARGRPIEEAEPPPVAWMLIRKTDRMTFLKVKYLSQFLLVEADDPEGPAPELVDDGASRELRIKEAEALLERALALMKRGEYERAFTTFQEVKAGYADLAAVSEEAERSAAECRNMLAEALYEKAQEAYEKKEDYGEALKLLDRIRDEYPDADSVVRKAAQLRRATEYALSRSRAQLRYETLLGDLKAALDEGNLPRAEELLGELGRISREGLEPRAGSPSPAQALLDYGKQLEKGKGRYEIDKKVLESHLRQDNHEQAREKLEQMRQRFPRHPEMSELEKLVASAEA
ncbi:MAG: tetratricopeptide repeat protein [Planctomycetota bacterium]